MLKTGDSFKLTQEVTYQSNNANYKFSAGSDGKVLSVDHRMKKCNVRLGKETDLCTFTMDCTFEAMEMMTAVWKPKDVTIYKKRTRQRLVF